MTSFNDIDVDKWKETDIWTDSLWIISQRDKSGKHDGFYHGNFVPQIPHQLISRYTKKGEIVFDPFVGSGTTVFEAETLERKSIGIDIQKELINSINEKIDDNENILLLVGDSASVKTFNKIKRALKESKVRLTIMHPPYFDIIKFSSLSRDLSNMENLKKFLLSFSKVLRNSLEIMDKNGYVAIVIGDKYIKGEWIPLGFHLLEIAQKQKLKLKSIVVKNMEGNRAKNRQQSLWRYRALKSDYYIFKHEYILIFKKEF